MDGWMDGWTDGCRSSAGGVMSNKAGKQIYKILHVIFSEFAGNGWIMQIQDILYNTVYVHDDVVQNPPDRVVATPNTEAKRAIFSDAELLCTVRRYVSK
jgi:hypothetical protein